MDERFILPGKYFLPIGINEYNHLESLLYAEADAEALRVRFEALGFETEPVWRATDFGYGRETERQLAWRLQELKQRFAASGGGLLVIFIAAHGVQAANGDTVIIKPRGHWDDLESPGTTLNLQREILAPISTWPNVNLVCLLDLCRSSAEHMAQQKAVRSHDMGGYIPPEFPWKNACVLHATQPTKRSFEIRPEGNRPGCGLFGFSINTVVADLGRVPTELSMRTLHELGQGSMDRLASGKQVDGQPMVQKAHLEGRDDILLYTATDATQYQFDQHDRRQIERARRHPDSLERWLETRDALSSHSRFHPEVESMLTKLRGGSGAHGMATATLLNLLPQVGGAVTEPQKPSRASTQEIKPSVGESRLRTFVVLTGLILIFAVAIWNLSDIAHAPVKIPETKEETEVSLPSRIPETEMVEFEVSNSRRFMPTRQDSTSISEANPRTSPRVGGLEQPLDSQRPNEERSQGARQRSVPGNVDEQAIGYSGTALSSQAQVQLQGATLAGDDGLGDASKAKREDTDQKVRRWVSPVLRAEKPTDEED